MIVQGVAGEQIWEGELVTLGTDGRYYALDRDRAYQERRARQRAELAARIAGAPRAPIGAPGTGRVDVS